jgi:aryl-alcohol dehydrogenase-like predicted oxidoreductase
VEEVMRGLDDLVRQGKILYAGISDAPAWWVAQANTLAELRGWTQFIGLQLEYSLIERTVERDIRSSQTARADRDPGVIESLHSRENHVPRVT